MNANLMIVVALLLSGCASAPQAATHATPTMTVSTAAVAPDAPAGLTAARFAGVEAVDRTIWANGTFTPDQAMRPPGAPFQSPAAGAVARVDVTPLVISGIPFILEADLKSTMTQGSAFTFFNGPNDDFRNGAFGRIDHGNHHQEAGFVRKASGPIVLVLMYDQAEPSPGVPYTLSAHVHADPTIVRAGFPVGLTVAPGTSNITIDLLGAKRDFAFDMDTPDLMLWGADDTFLGHTALKDARTTLALPNAVGGEYVMLLSQGGRSMRIYTNASTPASLRPLPQPFTISDPHTEATAQGASWTVHLTKVPVLAGVFIAPSAVTPDIAIHEATPAGVLFDGTATGPWINAPQVPNGLLTSQFEWDSAYGVPNLVAGDYTVTIASSKAAGSAPMDARDFLAFWTR